MCPEDLAKFCQEATKNEDKLWEIKVFKKGIEEMSCTGFSSKKDGSQKQGDFKWYHPSGSLKSVSNYSDNKTVNQKGFFKDGDLLFQS